MIPSSGCEKQAVFEGFDRELPPISVHAADTIWHWLQNGIEAQLAIGDAALMAQRLVADDSQPLIMGHASTGFG